MSFGDVAANSFARPHGVCSQIALVENQLAQYMSNSSKKQFCTESRRSSAGVARAGVRASSPTPMVPSFLPVNAGNAPSTPTSATTVSSPTPVPPSRTRRGKRKLDTSPSLTPRHSPSPSPSPSDLASYNTPLLPPMPTPDSSLLSQHGILVHRSEPDHPKLHISGPTQIDPVTKRRLVFLWY